MKMKYKTHDLGLPMALIRAPHFQSINEIAFPEPRIESQEGCCLSLTQTQHTAAVQKVQR